MNNSKLTALLDLDKSNLPPDGGESFNRLIFARSPYLLQHAENPVDWREWNDEAFAEARRRNVPLLISIGYATCHWCHVMAAESFNDHEVARELNNSFVAVKVDREERPDIDDFYMTAARVLTGGGGWPLNVFVDHERRPFFSITYLPKLPRQQTPGFLNLLSNLSTLWQQRYELVVSNSAEIGRSMMTLTEAPPAAGLDIDTLAANALQELSGIYDSQYGGFGNSIKFPMPTYLLFLLSRDGDAAPQAHTMARQTLEQMANGGINDQLAGGFHRYATDRQWLVPHFEKMLYDQALLIITYCEAFKVSGTRRLLETAVNTAKFCVNELMNSDGGFCAGLDADSEGGEGLYYTWSYAELSGLLGNDIPLAEDYWGVRREGNLEGRSILYRAKGEGINLSTQLSESIDRCRTKLLAARSRREAPLRDPKVICAWNGLMISALVRLSAVTKDNGWLQRAAATARFILENMVTPNGRLLRNWLRTPARVYAFAEDYAFFCLGLADLLEATAEPVWQEKLAIFGGELVQLFVDNSGNLSFNGRDAEVMPLAIPPLQDGVMPSAAGASATLLVRMARIFADRSYSVTAGRILQQSRGLVEKNPAAFLSLIRAEEELRQSA